MALHIWKFRVNSDFLSIPSFWLDGKMMIMMMMMIITRMDAESSLRVTFWTLNQVCTAGLVSTKTRTNAVRRHCFDGPRGIFLGMGGGRAMNKFHAEPS